MFYFMHYTGSLVTRPAGPCPMTGDRPATATAFNGLEKN